MDGAPGASGESGVSPPEIDLPAVLAGLDGTEPERREAIETVRATVDEEPAACAPTIPKLRDLLSGEETEAATVAYCLAEIAEATPTDVAPSTDDIVAFVAEEHPSPAATEGVRALAAVAESRPGAIDDHADCLAGTIEAGPEPDRGSPRLWEALERLGQAVPSVSMPAATRTDRTGRADRRSGNPEGGVVAVVPEGEEPES